MNPTKTAIMMPDIIPPQIWRPDWQLCQQDLAMCSLMHAHILSKLPVSNLHERRVLPRLA